MFIEYILYIFKFLYIHVQYLIQLQTCWLCVSLYLLDTETKGLFNLLSISIFIFHSYASLRLARKVFQLHSVFSTFQRAELYITHGGLNHRGQQLVAWPWSESCPAFLAEREGSAWFVLWWKLQWVAVPKEVIIRSSHLQQHISAMGRKVLKGTNVANQRPPVLSGLNSTKPAISSQLKSCLVLAQSI